MGLWKDPFCLSKRLFARLKLEECLVAIAQFNAEIIRATLNVVWLAAQCYRTRMHEELSGRVRLAIMRRRHAIE